MKKYFTLLLFTTLINYAAFASAGEREDRKETMLDWSYRTGNLIYSTVCVDDTLIYAGGFDSLFHTLTIHGVEQWKFYAGVPIKCEAVVVDSLVCFQGGNQLFALEKHSGKLVWKHQPNETRNAKPVVQLDPWDMKDASPIAVDGIIYYGNEYGVVYGIDACDGREVFRYETEIKAAVRTKPVIVDGVIYFGDHEGYVYAVTLSEGALKWSMRTNGGEKPYAQFGGIFGDMIVADGRLYFGIRNSRFQVLDIMNGKVLWEYESGGTWLSGTPSFDEKHIFVGTSDTHEFCAFDKETGKLQWRKNVQYGVYNASLEADDKLLIFTGDEQHPATMPGFGKVFVMKKNGQIENSVRLPGSVFNTPVMKNGKIYFSSLEGSIHCVPLEKLLSQNRTLLDMDCSEIDFGMFEKNSTVVKPLCWLSNKGCRADSLIFSISMDGIPAQAVKIQPMVSYLSGNDSIQLKLQLTMKDIPNGNHRIAINVSAAGLLGETLEKQVVFTRYISTGIGEYHIKPSQVDVFPNPFGEYISLRTHFYIDGETRLEIYDVDGHLIFKSKFDGEQERICLAKSTLRDRYYLLKVFHNELPVFMTKLMKE